GNTALTLNVAFDYGGRADIVEAARRIVKEGVKAEDIDERLFSRYLSSAGIPDPDLIVRTGGDFRISNFMLWQSAYSEYYSTPVLWPDFDEEAIDRALEAYRQRRRRFGRVSDESG
ncbi:MAG: di-trans,poly-cis-decaprenylcistransferase, partial [Gemmatimonadetes bacterium]|nr:di-trans,poly-cis-decaprenylcistransferase [Gemmatimonadota bacterium]